MSDASYPASRNALFVLGGILAVSGKVLGVLVLANLPGLGARVQKAEDVVLADKGQGLLGVGTFEDVIALGQGLGVAVKVVTVFLAGVTDTLGGNHGDERRDEKNQK